MAKLLAWTDAQRAREVDHVLRRLRGDIAFVQMAPDAASR
jgi:hypothetical protein